jgi:hypothetical protein
MTITTHPPDAGGPLDIQYDVPLVKQPSPQTCWAAAIAMLLSYERAMSIEVEQVAGPPPYSWIGWSRIEAIALPLGLREIAPAEWTPAGWYELLKERGPLWIVVKTAVSSSSSHAVVLTGMAGGATPEAAEMSINNPAGNVERTLFLDFTRRWDFGATAGASIFAAVESSETPLPNGSSGQQWSQDMTESRDDTTTNQETATATEEEFAQAVAASGPQADDTEVTTIEIPAAEEAIGGEATDVVNAGVSIIKLIANSAGVSTTRDGFAHALPPGVPATELEGWQGPNKIIFSWSSGETPWWDVFHVDYRWKLQVTYMFGGTAGGSCTYVDQVHVALDDVVLPPDFTLEVDATFPETGLKMGSPPVGGLQFAVTYRLKGFLGQLLSSEHSFNIRVLGTGAWATI